MFIWAVIISGIVVFIVVELLSMRHRAELERANEAHALDGEHRLREEEKALSLQVDDLEETMGGYFFFYELTRKLAPILDKKDLFLTFSEELKHVSGVQEVEFSASRSGKDYFEFRFGEGPQDIFCVKTCSQRVIGQLAHFAKLLTLCVERITLYHNLQDISIHDSLTGTFNRRYFTLRYLEEFERAKKFNLSVSFLMIDVDHFKKINDTYGHLVGDAVLREISRLIGENIREIDFLARFGGEEFALILPETDKAGAIMVAERLRFVVARERMRVFDEVLATTISLGVATYPQNTLYSDVLIEIVDKALYKAKQAGRNRVGWF
ncbi:MAG: GGDEF domain-containing protein [Candidatus Omnitrophota bacterium]|nr:GGDEF domain-containing protein [Candidatus Omnitrophota bacterium]